MAKIKFLKIITLVENLVQTGGFRGEWGLSFFLEVEDAKGRSHKIISDTGNSKETILHNIRRLKLDLTDLEVIFLSHGHGDHTAATVEIINLAGGGVKVITHPHLFLQRFYIDKNGKRRRGGVPRGEGISEIEAAGGEIIQSADPVEILPGLWTTGQIPRITSFEEVGKSLSGGERLIVVNGKLGLDQILDDQGLWMDVEGVGPMVITGCAHSGIINTLLHVKKLGNFIEIYGLVGGTHLVRRTEDYLQHAIKELQRFNLRLLSPCHCTGFKAMTRLYQTFPQSFVLNFPGRVIIAGEEPTPRVR